MKKDELATIIYKAARSAQLLQIATSINNQPWVASVYFVVDSKLNFYWLSLPERRHSRELANNSKAAIAIAIKQDIPVIGVQAEGEAKQVHSYSEIAKIIPRYVKKYGQGKDFLRLVKEGKNKHILYKFTPRSLQLFDELHYSPDQNPIVLLFE